VRALISVHDKSGLVSFARGLDELGFELVASGGSAAALEEAGIAVTRVETLTGFPEMLGGRVKTLHPRVHAGILARRDIADDRRALEQAGIEPFDLVCVNLYPFEQVTSRPGASEDEVIETIDIGGPALLRGAAKNHAFVTPVCRHEDYGAVLDELSTNGSETSLDTRRRLAGIAFATTAAYEAAIARWLEEGEGGFPETFTPVFDKVLDLSYGENPHQRAAYYEERGARRHLLSRVEQLPGKALSFNNLSDLSAARMLMRELEPPACVIVKHANPCGVAVAATLEEAYARALACDPLSAYGGVVVLNRSVSGALGEAIAEQFVEVLLAPSYEDAALDALARKASLRILEDTERRRLVEAERDYRRVLGGLLVQDRDLEVAERDEMDVVCGDVSDDEWDDLRFGWRVVKHVSSNAIVLAGGGCTIGIAAGETSRVDAVRVAVEKARDRGHSLEGAVLASDAFFPFADGPQLALDAGISALIQPGGSKRDAEVIEAVSAAGAAMVFAHERHFRH
jgi:phosphoribosylaminoimidazolecarboxamide formyltransferase/IMP cyclohydrolase